MSNKTTFFNLNDALPSDLPSPFLNHQLIDDEEELVLARAKEQHNMYLRQQEMEAEEKKKLLHILQIDAAKAEAIAIAKQLTVNTTTPAPSTDPNIARRIDQLPSRTMSTTPIRNRNRRTNGNDSHTSSGTDVSPPPTSTTNTYLEPPSGTNTKRSSNSNTTTTTTGLRPQEKLNDVFWSDVSSEHTSSSRNASRAATPNQDNAEDEEEDNNDDDQEQEEQEEDDNNNNKNNNRDISSASSDEYSVTGIRRPKSISNHPIPKNRTRFSKHKINNDDNDDDDTSTTTCSTSNHPDIYIPPPLPLLSQSSLPMRAQRALTGVVGRPESLRHFRHLDHAPKHHEPCLTAMTTKKYVNLFPSRNLKEENNKNNNNGNTKNKKNKKRASKENAAADVAATFYLKEPITMYARPDALREIDFWKDRMEAVSSKIDGKCNTTGKKSSSNALNKESENNSGEEESSSCGANAMKGDKKSRNENNKDGNETKEHVHIKKYKQRKLLVRPSTLLLRQKRKQRIIDLADAKIQKIQNSQSSISSTGQQSGERSSEAEDTTINPKNNNKKKNNSNKFKPLLKVDVVPSCTPSRHFDRTLLPTSTTNKVLKFDSQFESGNLLWSRLIGHNNNYTTSNNKRIHAPVQEYDLILQHDLFTNGNVQWFYYRVGNTSRGLTVRFNLINMKKSGSLFGDGGMQPCVYSQINARDRNAGWERKCTDVVYYNNGEVHRLSSNDYQRKQSTLSFIYKFEHDNDCVFFAMCHPYTYTDLQEDICSIRNDPERSKYVVFQSLCTTIAENRVDLLTITARASAPSNNNHLSVVERMKIASNKTPKEAVVLSSRVHPGETNASWMMRGVLDFLTGDSVEAQGLRETFVFKVIPMLNPDGVINGNYRCNLSGRDLNRKWASPNKWEQPSVHGMRTMFEKMNSDRRKVALFCDMHDRDPRPLEFAYMLSNLSHPFSFMDSRFKVQRSKYGTGRVVGWRGFGINLSFTMEASFCGPSVGPNANTQFRTIDLERMGRDFCLALYVHFQIPKLQQEKERLQLQQDMQSLSPISKIKKTITERAQAAQNILNEKKIHQNVKKNLQKNDVNNISTDNIEKDVTTEMDSEDYTDTEDENENDLSVLAAALASTMTLTQIEEIYEGGVIIPSVGNVNKTESQRKRHMEMDSGGSDSDASGDNLDDDELRNLLYTSLKPKFMMKSMSNGGLLSGSSKKKKKKKRKKEFDGDPHDYLKRKSKSLKVTGKIDLKGGVGRARRRRRKLLLEKQKMQQEQLENRQRRRASVKDKGGRDCWLSPGTRHDDDEANALGSKPSSAKSTTSMPDINSKTRSSTAQRVPLHTLLARQQAYLEARRRRQNNRTPLKLRATRQPKDNHQNNNNVNYSSAANTNNAQYQQQLQQHQQAIVQPQDVYHRMRNAQPDPFNLRYSNSQGGASTNIYRQSGMMQQRQTQHNMSLMQQQQQQLMQVAHHHQHQHQHQQYHSQFHQNQQAFAAQGGHFGNAMLNHGNHNNTHTSSAQLLHNGPSRVNFNFPDIQYQHGTASKAQYELDVSIQKAQQIYEQVKSNNNNASSKFHGGFGNGGNTNSNNANNSNSNNGNNNNNNNSSSNNISGGGGGKAINASSNVRLAKERELALQALQAALSGGTLNDSASDFRAYSISGNHQFWPQRQTQRHPSSNRRRSKNRSFTKRKNGNKKEDNSTAPSKHVEDTCSTAADVVNNGTDSEMGLSNYGTKFRSRLVHAGQHSLNSRERSNSQQQQQHQQQSAATSVLMRKSMSADHPAVFFSS